MITSPYDHPTLSTLKCSLPKLSIAQLIRELIRVNINVQAGVCINTAQQSSSKAPNQQITKNKTLLMKKTKIGGPGGI